MTDERERNSTMTEAATIRATEIAKPLEMRIEDLANWLHSEVEWPEYDFPDHSWPDHPEDDGKRGNGYLKIIPRSSADQFREIAARILSAVDPAFLKRIEALEAENADLRWGGAGDNNPESNDTGRSNRSRRSQSEPPSLTASRRV